LEGQNLLAAIVPVLGNLVTGFLQNQAEKSQAKQKLAVAKIEAKVTQVQSDACWEERAIDSSTNSIKDELWTCGFILLIAACMWPDAQPYIKEGFSVLKNDCPEWLSWGILASIAASFGLKSIGQFKK
tara:strand:- start:65 stop:448 length:384 start_codon:yes stop_codon:yes gene_type:complete